MMSFSYIDSTFRRYSDLNFQYEEMHLVNLILALLLLVLS